MDTRRKTFVVLLSLVMALVAGCKKSAATNPAREAAPQTRESLKPKVESLSRLHWFGKKRIAAQTNATPLMAIWNLPESVRFEKQTLDKLSTAPWRLLRSKAEITNAASLLLRRLLDDIVQEESYVEIRHVAEPPAEMVFAIRLDDARAGLWQSDLAAVVESLTSIQATPATNDRRGWSLRKQPAPNLIELARAGQWTVVGAAQGTNGLFGEMLSRIEHNHSPFPSRPTNHWFEASVDLVKIAELLSVKRKLPENTPRITMTIAGDGESVRTEGELQFPKPLTLEFETWNIPTNLIGEPLVGFTAIRGIQPWLAASESVRGIFPGPPPNQLFLWALLGLPAQTYLAAPLPDASNQVHHLSVRLMEILNPPLATNGLGSFAWSENQNGFSAQGIPFLSPFLQAVTTNMNNGIGFAFGGTLPPLAVLGPRSGDMLQTNSARTNLVCLDWENTGPRVETWLYLSQFLRMVSGKAQLPLDSASIAWLKAAESRLHECTTVVTKTGPATLSFLRNSSVGFTSIELHLLADWWESPQFPRGLHTFLAPPVPPLGGAPPPGAAPASQ